MSEKGDSNGVLRMEVTTQTLLALYCEMLPDQKPYTRSVYVARETLDETAGEPPALLVVEGLEFVLFLATEGDLDREMLAEWMMNNYCYQHYERKNVDTEQMEANARTLCISRPYPGLEEAWRQMANDDERAVHFLTVEQSELGEPLLRGMLSLYRENVVSTVTRQCLERQVELYAQYKRLLKKLASQAAVKAEMKCDPFFFIKSIEPVAVDKKWALAPKLAGKRVWAIVFDNHAIMEHFVDKLRWPIEIGGQLYPHRVEGRKVGVTVLEQTQQGELQQFDRRRTIPHDYTLRQTPELGKRWEFGGCKRQLHAGVLTPALRTTMSTQWGVLGTEPFSTVCKLARANDAHLSSNLVPLKLAWLDSAVLLVDARHHTETKKQVTLREALHDPLPACKKKPPEQQQQQQQEEAEEEKKPATLKRKKMAVEQDVIIVGTSAGAKKKKFSGKQQQLVQARLTGFTSFEKPRQ